MSFYGGILTTDKISISLHKQKIRNTYFLVTIQLYCKTENDVNKVCPS